MNRPPVPRPGNRDGSPAAALAALAAAAAAAARRKLDASLVAAIDARRFGAVRARIGSMPAPRASYRRAVAASGRNPATFAEPPSYPSTRRTPCVE